MSSLRLDPAEVIADLDSLAAASGGRFAGATRLAWTPAWMEARAWLTGRLADAGLTAELDPANNLWATIRGASDRALIVGSHVDAVPDGGWLDGALGSLTALAVVRELARSGETPPLTVRYVDWADEEGARFGRSLLGSSAAAGTLVPDAVADLRDADGVALVDALAACDVELAAAPRAAAWLRGAVAYLELHIEQGPVLLDSGRLAAAVSGTFGVERHLIDFVGQTAHAGSTPMHLRRDTIAAAATATLAIRESAIAHGGVATVGRFDSLPGVITAVAGHTQIQLDQRHLEADTLALMRAEALDACEQAAARFGCSARPQRIFAATPTVFDTRLVTLARAAVAAAGGGNGEPIPSGPLHDATEIGRIVPTAMIFAQSDPPISHAAIEDSNEQVLRVAIDAYGRTVAAVLADADAGSADAGSADAG